MSTPLSAANEPQPTQSVLHSLAGRDINVAGRDNVFTTNWMGLRYLRPKPAKPDAYIPQRRFVPPPKFEKARIAIRQSYADEHHARVVFLVAPEAHGRKSAALRLLTETSVPANRVYGLLPDWDSPDITCLPREPRSGYHLNLRGITQPLPADFCKDLVSYASELEAIGSYLVITATDSVCSHVRRMGQNPGIAVEDIERPKAIEIVEQYLRSTGSEDRIAWLNDSGSVFYKLLPEDSAPSEAIRFATLVIKAGNAGDKEVLDEYHDWKSHLDDWFATGGKDKVEERAKRIAIAFLDKTPASVVLDSADLLLASKEINWEVPPGGPLAIADAAIRLEEIGASFDEATGIASLIHESQGPAILRRIWTRHVQLSSVLTRWLQDISQQSAKDHLGTLATSLATLAETVGVVPIFSLAEGWLQNDEKSHVYLVADLVGDLAVHPTLGSKSRSELARWAKRSQQPARQRAAALACAGPFGKTYTSMALTRVRYILESPGDVTAKREAVTTLRSLAVEEPLAPAVVDALVKWLTHSDAMVRVFLDVFGSLSPQPDRSPLDTAFSLSGDSAKAVLKRLFDAWKHIITKGTYLKETEETLLVWRAGAEEGRLPMEPLVSMVLRLGPIMEPPLQEVIMRDGPFKDALIAALVAEREISPPQESDNHSKADEPASEAPPFQSTGEADPEMR